VGENILVVTVGTSPLPEYIATKYFLRYLPNKCSAEKYNYVFFICSEETIRQKSTASYAEKLEEVLGRDNVKVFYILLSDVSDPETIYNDLNEYFSSRQEFSKEKVNKVHLHYSGGTKAMAVYIYDFFKTKYGEKFESSYLDARDKRMIVSNPHSKNKIKTLASDDLRNVDEVSIDIDTLLRIHLYEKKEENESWGNKFCSNNFIIIMRQIEDIIKTPEKIKIFIAWLDDQFRRLFKSSGKFIEKTEEFCNVVKNNENIVNQFNEQLSKYEFIKSLLLSFPEEKRIINEDGKLWIPPEDLSSKKFKEKIFETVKFLDGKWLEYYVYNELKNKLLERGLKEGSHFGLSLKAKKKEGSNNSKGFELDIFVIRGYQLIGISITTSLKTGECKFKGFEVIHRVNQIGGEESKAILITAIDRNGKDSNPESLKEDLAYETGSHEEKIVVFGIDDWADIGDKIVEEVFDE